VGRKQEERESREREREREPEREREREKKGRRETKSTYIFAHRPGAVSRPDIRRQEPKPQTLNPEP